MFSSVVTNTVRWMLQVFMFDGQANIKKKKRSITNNKFAIEFDATRHNVVKYCDKPFVLLSICPLSYPQ